MLWKIAIGVVAVLLLAAVIGVLYVGPRNVIGILTFGQQAREGSLLVGDAAPEITVVSLDGVTEKPLTDWMGSRPLVLVFGSFT
jgi:hypothetical protein